MLVSRWADAANQKIVLRVLMTACVTFPQQAGIRYHLAEKYFEAGRYHLALEHTELLVRLFGSEPACGWHAVLQTHPTGDAVLWQNSEAPELF